MNRAKFQLLATAAMMMAAASDKQLFDTGTSKVYVKPRQKTDLPCWEVNGAVIYAKDAKTATKYAKNAAYGDPERLLNQLNNTIMEFSVLIIAAVVALLVNRSYGDEIR